MNIVSIIDFITLFIVLITSIALLKFWKRSFKFNTKIILAVLLAVNLFHSLSNFLEWSGITNALDPYEDYIQILKPLLWFVLFYAFIQETSEKKLKRSEKKYREAYNRAEFYKDLFAHDISNILQGILSASQLCKLNFENLDVLKELTNMIEKQVLRGSHLVSNIHILSQLEDNELFFQAIEVCKILKDSITIVKNTYPNKNIQIQIESINEKFFVMADIFLQRVFENILTNAIIHNNNPIVEVLLKISKEQKEGVKFLKIEFIDNGNGIEYARKEEIFQRGFKKDKSVSGLGLGLSLVKKIVTNYNGYIWVEDKVQKDFLKGSNFIILIPEAL